MLVAIGALLAVATAIYLPHVFTGGFYTDDWFFLQRLHFIDHGGGSLKDMLDIYGNWPDAYRPAQTAMLVGQYLLTGDSPRNRASEPRYSGGRPGSGRRRRPSGSS